MADPNVKIVITALNDTNRAFANLEQSLKQLKGEMGGIASQAQASSQGVKNLAGGFQGLGAAVAGLGLVGFMVQLRDTTLGMEKLDSQFRAIMGSAVLGARELNFVKSEVNRLGLSYQDTAEAYGKFSASIKGTSLEGEQGRKIFSGVMEGVTALKLSGEEAKGIFLALSQMASKGTVSMEELRQQFGERFPGAMKMAADSMGMTTSEFIKLVSEGKVLAIDLLPKLAEQMHKTYGAEAANAIQSTQAAINKLNNEMQMTKQHLVSAFGQQGGLLYWLSEAMIKLREFIAGWQILSAKVADKTMGAPSAFWKATGDHGGLFFNPKWREAYNRYRQPGLQAVDEQAVEILKKFDENSMVAGNFKKSDAELVAEAARNTQRKKGEGIKKDKKTSAGVAEFNSFVESFNTAQVQSEVDPYVRAWMDLDKKYSDLQQKYDLLTKQEKAEALKQGINQARIDSLKSDAQARLSAEELEKVLKANHKEEDAWRKAEAADLKERYQYEQRMIKESFELKRQQANQQNTLGNIQNNTIGPFQDRPDQYKALQLDYEYESTMIQARRQELEELGNLDAKQIEEHQFLTDKLAAIDAQYAANKKRLDRENWEKGASSIANSLETIGSIMMQGNKDQFEAGKAMAIASAGISMTLGAIQAFTSMSSIPYVGPALGAVAAAAVIASGTARIAQIESMKYEGREFGGPVTAGQTYLVGEKRPELFTPGVSGTITPFVPRAGGGTISTTQVFQISTGVSDTVRAEMARMAPALMQMSVGAVKNAMRDGAFQGA